MNQLNITYLRQLAEERAKHVVPEGYEYKGHKFTSDEERMSDCIKIFHDVIKPDGKRVSFPWSPYSMPTKREFEMFVELGCPQGHLEFTRPDGVKILHGNFDPTTIHQLYQKRFA